MKTVLFVIFVAFNFVLSGCKRDPVPYGSNILDYYKRNLKVEIILEGVHIDTTIHKNDMQNILQVRLDNYKKSHLEMCQYNYKRAKEDYELYKSDDFITNAIYKPKLEEAKKKLDGAEKEVFRDDMVIKYETLIKDPPIIEQLTIHYRIQEGGSINIEKFESEILNSDTTLRVIK